MFYLPQNGKPFHEEINHTKRPWGPHETALLAKGLGSPDVEADYTEIDNGLLLWRMMLQNPPKILQS